MLSRQLKQSSLLCSLGITLIELLLVIALIAILTSSMAPFGARFFKQNILESTFDQTVSKIRKAQQNAINDKDYLLWGFCLSAGSIRLYGGSCQSPVYSDDFTIPSGIAVTGLTDYYFSKHRGEPNSPITITVTNQITTKTIYINQIGGMDIY